MWRYLTGAFALGWLWAVVLSSLPDTDEMLSPAQLRTMGSPAELWFLFGAIIVMAALCLRPWIAAMGGFGIAYFGISGTVIGAALFSWVWGTMYGLGSLVSPEAVEGWRGPVEAGRTMLFLSALGVAFCLRYAYVTLPLGILSMLVLRGLARTQEAAPVRTAHG